jgi:GT2 family glycosyltransferase
MKETSRVLILIVNWNNYSDTKECLESLTQLTSDNYQVMLVDNGSGDNSSQLLEEEFPEIQLVNLQENLGFAGGNNVGLEYALKEEFPFTLLLNNDTIVQDGDFLAKLVQVLEEEPSVGAVGPTVEQTDGITQLSILPYPNIGNTIINSLGLYHPNHKKRQFVDSIAGCCVLVRREAIEQAGLLDENYFMYGEETEWFFRIRKKGWKILFLPVDSILHKEGSSSKKIDDKKIYIERRANVIYTLVKGKQESQAVIMAAIMVLLLGIRVFFSAITGRENKSPYRSSMIVELNKVFRQKWKMAKDLNKGI